VAADDIEGLVRLCQQERPGLVLIGPELPLTLGLADRLQQEKIPTFGPRAAAARLEGSKRFAKDFMVRHHIPTARYAVCTDLASALQRLEDFTLPVVIKADGLASGKGVIVAQTKVEAETAIRSFMQERIFGTAGDQVVIEEFLLGEEASILALTDGRTVVPLVAAQDHKRVYDNDQGPNTGGMGAYAPAPVMTRSLLQQVQHEILEPTVAGMAQEGTPYQGVLYAGIMITAQGPKVIEFNCRFGDPETQVVLPLLSSDLIPAALACTQGQLSADMVAFKDEAAVCVVMAAGGYPGNYSKGMTITGIEDAEHLPGVMVWHAGTGREDHHWIANGGRVLNVIATAPDIATAVKRVYEAAGKIHFEGGHYRHDIAYRALARVKTAK
jgi:phosphoribosylamine--glycine ligase